MDKSEQPQTKKEKLLQMLASLSPTARIALLEAAKERQAEMKRELGESYNPKMSLRSQWEAHQAAKAY